MKTSILDFFPKDPNSLLKNLQMKEETLSFLIRLLKIGVDALKNFDQKNFYLFDPHVGDTACQIRALKILFVVNKLKSMEIHEEIKILKECQLKVESILKDFYHLKESKNINICKNLASTETISQFLREKNLLINISRETHFLIISYFLTYYKEDRFDTSNTIQFNKISSELNVTRKYSKKLIHAYQVRLSNESISFIIDLLKKTPTYQAWNPVICSLQHKDDDGRSVIPCFLTIKVLLESIIKEKICVLVITEVEDTQKNPVDIFSMVFLPENGKFVFQETANFDFFMPCIVVQGLLQENEHRKSKTQYIQAFLKLGLENIILANMASHPQLSGKRLEGESFNPYKKLLTKHEKLTVLRELEEELLYMKELSYSHGCCEKNKTLFMIKHIFCDTYGHQIDLLR